MSYPPMVKCLHCGSFNQDTPENMSDRCWKCQGELAPVNKRVYMRPTIIMLRLERKVAECAAKWWKVEDLLDKQAKEPDIPSDFEDTKAYALREFIVKLAKEG